MDTQSQNSRDFTGVECCDVLFGQSLKMWRPLTFPFPSRCNLNLADPSRKCRKDT